ncbi:hypothetical protein GCM10007933_15870 [Zoogloea oryzae]|uniref:Uncharacterized protein n=1 Tax=Zoogloea oryzae TaxID=310767 RepID=A0ABQ6FAV9_9RHOO|nr:hypothetical protein GCM10007933_15870 [Zoogloea oryzae]
MKARRPSGEQTGELPIHHDGSIKTVESRCLPGASLPLDIEERGYTMKERDPGSHTQRRGALLGLPCQGTLKGKLEPELILGDTLSGDADQRSAAQAAVEHGSFWPLILMANRAGVP